MDKIWLGGVVLGVGCATEPAPVDEQPAELCASSTLPEADAAWDACREADDTSWPLFCDEGEVPPPCSFEVATVGEDAVLCRRAGPCE